MRRTRPTTPIPEPWSPERRLVPRDWKSMDEARIEWELRCAQTSSEEVHAALSPEESQQLFWRKLAWGILDGAHAGDFDRCAREVQAVAASHLGLAPRAPYRAMSGGGA